MGGVETWDGRGGGQARAPAKPLPSPGTAPSIWPSCRRPSAGSAHGSSVSARDRYIRHHSFWYAFESRDAVWIRMWPATRCTCECCSICTAWTDASVGGAGCGSDANREAASDPYHLKPRQVHAAVRPSRRCQERPTRSQLRSSFGLRRLDDHGEWSSNLTQSQRACARCSPLSSLDVCGSRAALPGMLELRGWSQWHGQRVALDVCVCCSCACASSKRDAPRPPRVGT